MSVELKKLCNICNEDKVYKSYDEHYACKRCNDGFICHNCIYEYIEHIEELKTTDDDTGYDVSFKMNCPICRQVFHRCI